MNDGMIFVDMNVQEHPTGSQIYYMMKRWSKYSIYSKTGPWTKNYTYIENHTPPISPISQSISKSWCENTYNSTANTYSTNSIHLYDYIMVTDAFYNSMVYTSSVEDSTPGSPGSEDRDPDRTPNNMLWTHYQNTFRNRPNSVINNYLWPYTFNTMVSPMEVIYSSHPSSINMDTYLEIVSGYPRNHFIYKRPIFSLYSTKTTTKVKGTLVEGFYRRSQQTVDSTIGSLGLEDGSPPIQSTIVGTVIPVLQSNNVINQ